MTAIETEQRKPRRSHLRVEPTAGLQWSQALELPTTAATATRPAEIRRAYIHRAPEDHVLAMYREACGLDGVGARDIPAPWWLRALARGDIESRAAAFRVEDRIAQLLEPRSGWEFVPWAADGESGYWEFIPSERGPSGFTIPTTLLHTERHDGWIDVLPAHSGPTPAPVAIHGQRGLRERLGEIEAIR
ncbi:MAG: hypothetical protein GEU86_05455 [Actinophytocola sp.]|nr:hypothetical protein [Actinophytocola sp.]